MPTHSRSSMPALQPLLVAAVVGALAGAYASRWRMYKDSIYQGFGARRFAGSVAVGAIVAMALKTLFQLRLPEPAAVTLLFGLAYAAHRGTYQLWEIFFRRRDRPDFVISGTFNDGGISVTSRSARIAADLCYVLAVGLFLVALAQLDRSAAGPATIAKGALAGLVAGVIIATSGAWKNAPTDGFQMRSFIRSPSITVAFALGLSFLTDSYLHLAVAAIGYERAVVETWKILCAHIAARLSTGPWA